MNETVILKVYGNNTIEKIEIGLTSIQSGHTNNMIEDVLGMRYKAITNTWRGKRFTNDGMFEDVTKSEDGEVIIEFDDDVSKVIITPLFSDNSIKFDFYSNSEEQLLAIRETILHFFNTEYGKDNA